MNAGDKALAAATRRVVATALAEDVAGGDWTTRWTVPAAARAVAEIRAKAPGIIAGLDVAAAVFQQLDRAVEFSPAVADGAAVAPGDLVATVSGPARAILTGERTALNLLQRLSGVATMTRRYVDAVAGTGVRILDTRKTTPGLRLLEKAAVRAGGGANHRTGLFDMILLKENHIAAAGGITAALRLVAQANQTGLPVEVEVRNLDELREAIAAGADRILLDNMSLDAMREAVAIARSGPGPAPLLEASGNMTLERVRDVAATGVDFISVGALTHSAPALDLSLLLRTP